MISELPLEISEQITANGFAIAKNIIQPKIIDQIDAWINEHQVSNDPLNPGFHGDALVISNLHAKNILFWDLIAHPFVLDVCSRILNKYSYNDNEGFTITGAALRAVFGAQRAQQLHIDSNLPGCNHILSLQVCFPIDSFSVENGPTCVVPGSQNVPSYPPNGNSLDDKSRSSIVPLVAEPGDVIIFNSGIWHGAGTKTTHSRRAAVFINYCRWFLKQEFDIANNMPPEILSRLTDQQLRLAGSYFQPPFDEFDNRGRKSKVPIIRQYTSSRVLSDS